MKLIRFLAACVALTLVSSLAPGFAPPVSAAGVLVTSPETVPATPGQTLALGTLFQPVRGASLSFQYISVVVTLTAGLTLAEIAAASGVTIETARSYLRRVLEKTGCHRQALRL